MQQRTLDLVYGDESGDGHSISRTITVILEGPDLSDESLNSAFNKGTEIIGFNFFDLFTDYEDSYYSLEQAEKLTQAGYQHPKCFSKVTAFLSYEEQVDSPDTPPELDVTDVIMFIIGLGMSDFSYKVVRNDTLLGSYNGILAKSFGYGLFQS